MLLLDQSVGTLGLVEAEEEVSNKSVSIINAIVERDILRYAQKLEVEVRPFEVKDNFVAVASDTLPWKKVVDIQTLEEGILVAHIPVAHKQVDNLNLDMKEDILVVVAGNLQVVAEADMALAYIHLLYILDLESS